MIKLFIILLEQCLTFKIKLLGKLESYLFSKDHYYTYVIPELQYLRDVQQSEVSSSLFFVFADLRICSKFSKCFQFNEILRNEEIGKNEFLRYILQC